MKTIAILALAISALSTTACTSVPTVGRDGIYTPTVTGVGGEWNTPDHKAVGGHGGSVGGRGGRGGRGAASGGMGRG